MNGDNKPDILAVTTYGGDISIFNNDGTGMFTRNYNTSIGSVNRSAAIGDFNNDNINDFVITSWDSDRFNVFQNSNTGFTPFGIKGYEGSMESIYTKELTGDNNLDLILVSRDKVNNYHTLSVFKGTGTGSFDLTESYAAGTGSQTVVLEDLDGNGIADMALLDGDKLSIYLSKKAQQISNTPSDLCLKGSVFTITATSGLPVILTSSDPSIFAVLGNSATTAGVGLVTITALQIGNSDWAGVYTTSVITVYQESVPSCDSVVTNHLIPDQVTLSGGSFMVTIPGCYFLHHAALLTLKIKGPAALLPNYIVNFTSPGIVTITGSHPGSGQLPSPTYVLGVVTVVSGPVTAIEQSEALDVLKIYPNPSQGSFIIELSSNAIAKCH
jgi:hypothetical protein